MCVLGKEASGMIEMINDNNKTISNPNKSNGLEGGSL